MNEEGHPKSRDVQIADEGISAYLQRIRVNFPTFRAFGSGDGAVDATERNYKMELVQLFQTELAHRLGKLSAEASERRQIGAQIAAFFTRRLSDGSAQNLVNWRYWTALTRLKGDGQSDFAVAVAALLYGPGSIEARIDAFVPTLRELLAEGGDDLESWPAKSRILPTFLLMLSDPQRHCIVKSEEFKRAMEALANEKQPPQPLNGEDYRWLLDFLSALRASLADRGLRPRDMVDVQTFIWVGDRDYTPDDLDKATSGNRAKAPAEIAASVLVADLAEIERDVPDITEREQLAKARVGQGRFRASVAAKWARGEVCALTGIAIPEMLVASHIKAWRDSENHERLDPMNGLLLAAHADRLFDRHLMSFKKTNGEYVCVVHPQLRLEAKRAGIADGARLSVAQLGLSDERRFEKYMSEHLSKHLELVEKQKPRA
ncbi:HNH endonuclease signature motif containing protein [Caballeronia sp. ATUFL_M2_KS44]|uniref:HNH endonuclease n=1 Tax=Caballeronia sp. ATUFL_M2_KS44 TaxID=2921767 RepID=UPI0020281A57|nr:HNH endonuclease signature motif containing protein [Caballeronia sp. ATUFL_M2_KS44]